MPDDAFDELYTAQTNNISPDFEGILNDNNDNKATSTIGIIKWMTWNKGLLLILISSVITENGLVQWRGYSVVRNCFADTISHSL